MVQQMLTSLEVLLAWAHTHDRLTEAKKAYYLLQSFAQSANFASSLLQLLTLTTEENFSIFERKSGVEKLDSQLNSVKIKALDCIL